MELRWEREASGRVRYLVDGRDAGQEAEGFDRVLELVGGGEGPLTVVLTEYATGGEDLEATLPFRARLDELRARLADRPLRYAAR